MVDKPRMVREADAYGLVPEAEAYGRVSNVAEETYPEDIYDDNNESPEWSPEEQARLARLQAGATPGFQAYFDGDRFRVEYDGEVVGDFAARSGYPSLQDKVFTYVKERGPIPEGNYMLNYSNFQQYDKNAEDEEGNEWMKKTKAWGYERVPLIPQKGTDTLGREGFYVHGGTNGLKSAGCIDLGIQMPQFGGIMKKYEEDIPVIVKYHDDFGKVKEKKENKEK